MPDTQHKPTAISTLYDQLIAIETTVNRLEAKIDNQQGMLERIFKVLDAAFSRFGDVLKSPFLQNIFANIGTKPKEIPPDDKSAKT